MAMLTLASWTTALLTILFVLVCMFMALVILIQKPKGGGLAGAFGGAGSSAAVFGAKTGDVLTWFTVGCFALFLALSMALVYSVRSDAQALPEIGIPEPVQTTTEGPITNIPPVPPATPSQPTPNVPTPAASPAAPVAPAAPKAPAPAATTPAPAAPATPAPAPAPQNQK